MAGPATATGIGVWLMTGAAAEVQLEYWPHGRPEAAQRSVPVAASPLRGHTVRIDLDGLLADTRYAYRVLLDGAAVELSELTVFTTAPADPAAPRELVIATGSCNYVPDPPYESRRIPSSRLRDPRYGRCTAPDVMLWLGTASTTATMTSRSRTRQPRLDERWAATRSFAPCSTCSRRAALAIWDDHDYGRTTRPRLRTQGDGARAVPNYWANPGYGLPGLAGSSPECHSAMSNCSCSTTVITRRRWRRGSGADESRLAQLEWLKGRCAIRAPPSSWLPTQPHAQRPAVARDAWRRGLAQLSARTSGLSRLACSGAHRRRVLPLGRHPLHAPTERERPGTYPLTELTCSPLTARVHPRPFPVREVPGTLVTQRNFCTLEFSGSARERLMRVAAWNANGVRLWEADFPAARLRTPKARPAR